VGTRNSIRVESEETAKRLQLVLQITTQCFPTARTVCKRLTKEGREKVSSVTPLSEAARPVARHEIDDEGYEVNGMLKSTDAKVVLLGTGSALPNPRRVATSHLLVIGEEQIMVDCGPGSIHRLAEAGVSPRNLTRILITHLHADHCSDLASIVLAAFLQGREAPLPIDGPPGLRRHTQILFEEMFPYIATLLAAFGKRFELRVNEMDDSDSEVIDTIRITAGRVVHGSIAALAFRIDSPSGSIVFSGDTAPCDRLVELAQNVDVLVHECPYPDSNGPNAAHTIPNQLGPLAARANPKVLVMNHFFPMCDNAREDMIRSVASTFSGDIVFGEDLQSIALRH
jgi:ribonuclease Z